MFGTGEVFGEEDFDLPILRIAILLGGQFADNQGNAFSLLQAGGEGVGEAFFDTGFFDESIDDNFDGMGLFFIQVDGF